LVTSDPRERQANKAGVSVQLSPTQHGTHAGGAARPPPVPADCRADEGGRAWADAPHGRGRAPAPSGRAAAAHTRGALLPRGRWREGGLTAVGGGDVGEGVAERGGGRPPRDGRSAPAPRGRVMGGEAERRRREARRGHGGGHPRRVPGGRPGQGLGAQLGGRAGSVGRRERGGPRRERARLRAGKLHAHAKRIHLDSDNSRPAIHGARVRRKPVTSSNLKSIASKDVLDLGIT